MAPRERLDGGSPREARGAPQRLGLDVLALDVGGMGARERNFYNQLACRYGDADAARTIQDLDLAGRQAEAEAAVPDALVDDVAPCGPRERIRDGLGAWQDAGVTTLTIGGDVAALRLMAEVVL